MQRSEDSVLISPAVGSDRQTALELIAAARCANIAGAVTALQREMCDAPSVEPGLFVARRGRNVIGAVWAERLISGTMALWGPVFVERWQSDVASRLIATARSYADQTDTAAVHALVRADETGTATALQQAGFVAAGEVGFLVCDRAWFPANAPALPCALSPLEQANMDRISELLQQTFEGTLDCPELCCRIQAPQMVATYLAQCDRRLWFAAYDQGRDAGCLLTGMNHETSALTLQYVGVVPRYRGRGWGQALTRQTLWIAREHGLSAVELAVDLRNWPAMNIYRELHFEMHEQRQLWLSGT